MFSHPQTAGVFYAPFAAWFITRIFLERWVALPRWVIALSVLFAGMIVASGARTAMLATFVSVGLTLVVFLIRGRSSPANRTRGQIIGFSVAMLGLALVILFSGVLNEELEAIVYKGDEETGSLTEAFQSSRGAGVSMHIENFLDAPLTGHGFGVYREGAVT
jgi:O-antigen ligase